MDQQALTEIKRHFDVVAEGLTSQIQQLAEGVLGVDEKLDRVRGEIGSELKEAKALVKLSFAGLDRRVLDRRVTGLEDTVASLAGRVERLETTVSARG
jgi:hypothetical protein